MWHILLHEGGSLNIQKLSEVQTIRITLKNKQKNTEYVARFVATTKLGFLLSLA